MVLLIYSRQLPKLICGIDYYTKNLNCCFIIFFFLCKHDTDQDSL